MLTSARFRASPRTSETRPTRSPWRARSGGTTSWLWRQSPMSRKASGPWRGLVVGASATDLNGSLRFRQTPRLGSDRIVRSCRDPRGHADERATLPRVANVIFDEVVHTDYGQFDLVWGNDLGFDGDF